MFRLALTALALAAAPAAHAEDARIATRPYVSDSVVSLAARPGYQATLAFGTDERIENIAIGDSAGWQVTPNRRADLLFVKPVGATAPVTNMTVVTNRHTYLFELRPAARATPVYLLRFTYAEPAPAPEPPPAEDVALIPVAATTELPVNRFNFDWTMRGDRQLYPARVFDDGQAVYLAWAAGRTLPAVLAIGPDGKTEGPVNFVADGDYLIVAGRHDRLVLRAGRDMATLTTSRPEPSDALRVAAAR